jgi:hypothetical protein
MEGKKFAIGLFAGLLLGIAIITASGGLMTLPSGASPASKNTQGGSALTTTALVTETTIVSQTETTTSVPAYVAVGNKSITSTTTTPAAPGSNSLNSDLTGVGTANSSTPAYSSRVQSITHQPVLTDTVVFVPVLVAFLLGALLYRASNRGKEQPSESQLRD